MINLTEPKFKIGDRVSCLGREPFNVALILKDEDGFYYSDHLMGHLFPEAGTSIYIEPPKPAVKKLYAFRFQGLHDRIDWFEDDSSKLYYTRAPEWDMAKKTKSNKDQ